MAIHFMSVIPTLTVIWIQLHMSPSVSGTQLKRLILRGSTKSCLPVFNCEVNYYVKVCEKTGMRETCEPCKEGTVQPNLISSLDEDRDRECFRPLNAYGCPIADTVHSRIPYDSVWCSKKCRCNTNKCFWGSPCICDYKEEPCKVNEELDIDTGECKPCPEGKYKPNVGCGPCYIDDRWLLINTSSDTTTPFENNITTEKTRLAEDPPMKRIDCEKYIIVMVVIVILLIIVLIGLLIKYVYAKLRKPSTKYKCSYVHGKEEESLKKKLTIDDSQRIMQSC